MEFTIQKADFLNGLYLASGIADRKSTMPILANVLLRSDGKERIVCAATDLNVAVSAEVPARCECAMSRVATLVPLGTWISAMMPGSS